MRVKISARITNASHGRGRRIVAEMKVRRVSEKTKRTIRKEKHDDETETVA